MKDAIILTVFFILCCIVCSVIFSSITNENIMPAIPFASIGFFIGYVVGKC